MKYLNYLFAEKSVQIAKTMLFSLFLALLPGNPLAAQCMLACNSGLVVEVPSGGSYELLPDILGEGGLAQTCPGGSSKPKFWRMATICRQLVTSFLTTVMWVKHSLPVCGMTSPGMLAGEMCK